MGIYDNNGTVNTQIGKVYDNNGTVNTQIGKVYDNNGTTNSLIYSAETYLYPGASATVRQSGVSTAAGTFYAVANPHNVIGNSAAAFVYIGSNSYSTITMTVRLTTVPIYGYLYAGIGDFGTYDLTGLGPSISIGYSQMNTGSGYYSGQVITITCTGAQAAGHYMGVAAVYRSSAGNGGRIDVTSIIAT